MARRKRLTPAQPGYLEANPAELETKSMAFPATRAPVAQVAGEASAAAALQELAGEVKRARDEGWMIQALPEGQVEAGYLVRDRMLANETELAALMESLRARGQQTPVEVVQLGEARYGLISGWRRLTALRRLRTETGEDRFAMVQAVLRQPETAADAYIAMVEENEIRVGLSYYERARVAAKAVEQGVYDGEKQALLQLFSTASRPRRSKIRSFLTLYHAADDLLRFPMAIGERLGLALAKRLNSDPEQIKALRAALTESRPEDASAELICLENFLSGTVAKLSLNPSLETDKARPMPLPHGFDYSIEGINVTFGARMLTLKGPGVNDDLRQRLLAWLKDTS